MLRTGLPLFMLLMSIASYGFAQQAAAGAAAKADARPARPATVINLNTATAADLQELPGIGAKVAARIIDYRQKNGPFKKVEELMNVQGIGEKSFLKLRNQLTVSASPAAVAGTKQ